MFINQTLFVIVPHRGVHAGKSRLAPLLGDMARSKLNRWLLERTLGQAQAWLVHAQRCLVISPCEVTLALARKAGALALREQPATVGLNAALSQAAAHAASLGAQRLLILPSDLPRLDAAALEAMQTAAALGTETVIAPDHHHQGTNALLVDADVRKFAFGKNSLARHIAQSDARRTRSFPCLHPALAFDLDTPADFAAWAASPDVPHAFLATLPRTAPPAVARVTSRNK